MLRVRVEIVPWGREDMAEEVAVLHIGNLGSDSDRRAAPYSVYLVEGDEQTPIGVFRQHRRGWYRNRLNLAARALRLLQKRRNAGEFLPKREPFGDSKAYE